MSFKYQQCGYYLNNEFVDNERLEINVIFNNKCNIVQIPGKGILNKKNKKLGNLYLILTYDYSHFDISNKDMPEKPVYYTMNPYDLIEKL